MPNEPVSKDQPKKHQKQNEDSGSAISEPLVTKDLTQNEGTQNQRVEKGTEKITSEAWTKLKDEQVNESLARGEVHALI